MLNMENSTDIKKEQISKNIKFYYMPVPFGFPMYDPYNTGPMSEPILSPVGPPIAPRRNPYYPKPTNPFLNPYSTQMRTAMRSAYLPPAPSYGMGSMSGCPHPGGMSPMGPPPGGMMGPPPMGPMGPRIF